MYISYVKVALPEKLVLPMKSLDTAPLETRHCSQQTSPHFGHILLPYFLISLFKGVFPFFEETKLEKGTNLNFHPKLRPQVLVFFLILKDLVKLCLIRAPGTGSRVPTRKGCRRAVVKPCGLAAVGTEGLYFGLCHQPKGSCDPGEGTEPLLVPDPLCPPLGARGHQ